MSSPEASGNNDVKRVESRTVRFANLKFSYHWPRLRYFFLILKVWKFASLDPIFISVFVHLDHQFLFHFCLKSYTNKKW